MLLTDGTAKVAVTALCYLRNLTKLLCQGSSIMKVSVCGGISDYFLDSSSLKGEELGGLATLK